MKTELYLSHALSKAPEEFRQRMFALRRSLNQIPDVEVLEFNWIPGIGPDRTRNTFEFDMDLVGKARIMIGVLDHPSDGHGMEVRERCRIGAPMRLFYPVGQSVSSIIRDCISLHRKMFLDGRMTFRHLHIGDGIDPLVYAHAVLPDPIPYRIDDEIVGTVVRWIERNQPLTFSERVSMWAKSL